jgi:uroporphyrinogen decarboxylase
LLQPFQEAFPTMAVPEKMDRESLEPVYRTLGLVKTELPDGVGLIGFAGAPWTLACYMIEGGGSKDYAKVRAFAYADPVRFERLISRLTAAVADHLIAQIAAGADVVQIFESWGGVLPEPALQRWSVEPIRAITRRVKAAGHDAPVVVFPRGVGLLYRHYLDAADALSLDTTVPLDWAAAELQGRVPVQGNLDPAALLAGGEAMRVETGRILSALGRGRFVFNLGHGVLPETPPDHVSELVGLVRAWRG